MHGRYKWRTDGKVGKHGGTTMTTMTTMSVRRGKRPWMTIVMGRWMQGVTISDRLAAFFLFFFLSGVVVNKIGNSCAQGVVVTDDW